MFWIYDSTETCRNLSSNEKSSPQSRKIQSGDCDGLPSAQVQKRRPCFFGKLDVIKFRSRFKSVANTVGGLIRLRNGGMAFLMIFISKLS